MTLEEWNWLVPTVTGTKWLRSAHQIYSDRQGLPSVNVFCRHKSREPFLFGRFTISAAVYEQSGKIFWGFDPQFRTGDGNLINLKKATGEIEQTLVGNDPVDLEALRGKLNEVSTTANFELTEEVMSAINELTEASENTRLKWKLDCPKCGYAINVRADVAQSIFSELSRSGFYEITTRQLAKLLQ